MVMLRSLLIEEEEGFVTLFLLPLFVSCFFLLYKFGATIELFV